MDQVAVAEDARRQGLATCLYGDAVTFAAGQGFGTLACEVNLRPPNPTSLSFHQALGFRSRAELRTGDGRTVSLQLLDLASAHTTA